MGGLVDVFVSIVWTGYQAEADLLAVSELLCRPGEDLLD